MDDLERMYRHLVRTIRASFPLLLHEPFEVGQLYQSILPYRLHRKELELDTNQDYELTLLELLTGARGLLVVDDRMRDVLTAERASPNPDPAVLREYASAHVALAPEPLQRVIAEGRGSGAQPTLGGSPARSSTPARPAVPTASAARASGMTRAPTPAAGAEVTRRPSRAAPVAAEGDACPYCKGELPAGRANAFCPRCGQDLTVMHCPACGSELERGWKFCVTCGRTAPAGNALAEDE